MPRLHHDPVDCIKKQLVQAIGFQKMAEFAQRCFIRNSFRHEVDPGKFPHGIAVINGILGCRVGQVEPNLKQIHPQHLFNPHRRTAALSFGVVRLDNIHPLIPGDDFVHDLQKFFPLGFLLAEAVLDICECFLLHCIAPPLF